MRHVITGGSGFTGSALTRALAERHAEIVNFDLEPPADLKLAGASTFVKGDIKSRSDIQKLALQPDDVVYHLAARQFANAVPARGRDQWFEETNVLGTAAILEAMQASGTRRLVFFSTDMTYGVPEKCPVPPDHPQNPLGPYGRSKAQAEQLIRTASGIRATIFRPRLIVGPGRLGILAKLFKLIKAGLPVPMIGSGNNRYQMVGVEDCARAALLAVAADCPPGPFNLGSRSPPRTRELLHNIIQHAGSRSVLLPVPAALLKPILSGFDALGLPILYPEQFGIADIDILLDTQSTEQELGWQPASDDIAMMAAAYDRFIAGSGNE